MSSVVVHKERNPVPILGHIYKWDIQRPLDPISNIVKGLQGLEPDQGIFLIQWSRPDPDGEYIIALFLHQSGIARIFFAGHSIQFTWMANADKLVRSQQNMAIRVTDTDDDCFFAREMEPALGHLSSVRGNKIEISFYKTGDQQNPTGTRLEVKRVDHCKYQWRIIQD